MDYKTGIDIWRLRSAITCFANILCGDETKYRNKDTDNEPTNLEIDFQNIKLDDNSSYQSKISKASLKFYFSKLLF